MSWLKSRLEMRKGELVAIYDPRTAFGNEKILALLQAIEEDKAYLETHGECPECDGNGMVPHECTCELCTICDEECGRCYGEGYTESK